MHRILSALAASAAIGVAGAAAGQTPGAAWRHASWIDAPQVDIKHAAVRLVVIAEPRRDISVTVAGGRSRLPLPTVHRGGGRIVVDGGLANAFGSERIDCHGENSARWVAVGGYGRIDYADLPLITAHVPLDARVAGEGAVYGQIGATRSLQVAASGCGDWAVGAVQGTLEAALSGSGDMTAADVGSLKAKISGSSDFRLDHIAAGADVVLAGSGNLRAHDIAGPLQAQVAGSGDLEANRVNGPVRAEIAGSGDVRLHSGYAPEVQARVTGSGSFALAGEAGQVQAEATGSGGIRIDHARGPVSQTSSGSAEIAIGR